MASARIVARQLAKDVEELLKKYQSAINQTMAEDIGFAIVGEMLNLISKGISPIQGRGRFPAYKWAAFRNALRKESSAIGRALKRNKKAMFRFNRKNERQLLLEAKERTRRAGSGLSNKYPFTKFAISQGKKPRPVNLLLTGEFLFHLEAIAVGVAGKQGIEIGFFDEKNAAKERGHREGANGQPERPIIPVDREEWAISIQRIILQKAKEAFDRVNARASSSN